VEEMLREYLPILVFLAIAIALGLVLILAAILAWIYSSSRPAIEERSQDSLNASVSGDRAKSDIVNAETKTAVDPPSPSAGIVLEATGYVIARRQATVSAKITGKITSVLVEEGMFVEQGTLLAQLDDSIPLAQYELAEAQLEAAMAALSELDVSLRQAQLDLTRTRELAQNQLASEADLDRDSLSVEAIIARVTTAQKNVTVAQRSLQIQTQIVEDMRITAPFDGVVVTKSAQPGEMISPISAGGGFTRTGICTIVDMSSLEVEVDVNEAYINRTHQNQPVLVVLNAYPDIEYSANVIAIVPAADRNKATVRLRVGFVERDERILPDMGVRVRFLADDQAQGSQHGCGWDETRSNHCYPDNRGKRPTILAAELG